MLKTNSIISFILIFFLTEELLVKSKKLLFSNLEIDEISEGECPENCLDNKCDNETLKCDNCKDGFYTDKCDIECPIDQCLKCTQDKGECTECKSTHHLVNNLCCEKECALCDENGCLECESLEKYGLKCDNCSNTCQKVEENKRKCDQESGKCTLCENGKRGDLCTEPCNEGCNVTKINCNQDDGKCECKTGYFGDLCDGKCDENCLNCEKSDGVCTECKSGYYIDLKDNTKCNKCPENCLGECPEGKCSKCKNGFFGDICDKNCSKNCLDDICDKDTGKCANCKNGFFGDICDKNCSKNCLDEICDKDTGKCANCKNGFFGDICDKNCSKNCVNERCDKDTGKCKCINHYSEESNCTTCIDFYDLSKQCSYCLQNYDIDQNCTKCINHFDITTNCVNCSNHYSLQSQCQNCINNYNPEDDCKTCINHYNPNDECKTCLYHYNPNDKCNSCINYYDPNNECKTCMNYYNPDDDCKTCLNHYNPDDKCKTCLNHYDIKSNCTKCEVNFDESNSCKTCIKNYNISNNCTTCNNYFDIETKCQKCLTGYYGEQCDKLCPEGCNTTIENCDQNRGYCYECKDLYYGYPDCQHKSQIPHCIKVEEDIFFHREKCIKCETKYYLSDNECKECSVNCTDKLCEDETGKCYSCSSLNVYGDFCEQICSPFCVDDFKNETLCDRDKGTCNYGCKPGNFSNDKCDGCYPGFYPIDKGCNLECSDNCENKMNCDEKDGSCPACNIGFWGKNCTQICSEQCKKRECSHEDGKCLECVDGFYKNKTSGDCLSCPENCIDCEDEDKCTSCIEGKYGINQCKEQCSEHCEGDSCEIEKGKCNCQSKYFGEKCESICEGCSDNGCEDKNGICNDHYCLDNYYDPRKCNQKCSDQCLDKKCDIFTGECLSCPENYWGVRCEKRCSNECKDDGRLDCCYIKDNDRISKGVEIKLSNIANKNNLKMEQNEFNFMYLQLGEFNLKILVDFETNSPLVIFDVDTTISQIESEIYSLKWGKTYNSSKTKCIKEESLDGIYAYDGFTLTKETMAKDNLTINNVVYNNFSFLICQEFKIEKDFETAGEIDGIVGLGLRNYFTENLFYNKEYVNKNNFPKNILVKYLKTNTIYFGDYPEYIKNSFSKLSTMIIENKQDIVMDKLIVYETKFTGIAYSLRKAYHYQYDKKVILNNRIETAIVFNNLYKQFFEKIYFGDLFENGCYFKNLQGGEGEYYCEKGKRSQIENLPKLGLILGDYIYYLSHNFLYKESEDYFTFIIKLHGQGQQKIELGKSFFNEFSVIYNNGNETLNFYGDIKKLNVPLRDPSNLLNVDSDIFTPGGWVTLIVFITVIIIIFCYLIKYCGEKSGKDDEEEDDIDYEEDSLIDDTLE